MAGHGQVEGTPIVLDIGSNRCKIDFAGEDYPRHFVPTTMTISKHQNITDATANASWQVLNETKTHCGDLTLKYPMEHGIVTDWDDMEKIWHHAFHNCLGTDPKEQPVLLTEALLNPKSNREKMVELMFEKFQVPAGYVALQPLLAHYTSGRVVSVCCDSGDGVTQVLPIYEGYTVPDAMQRVDFGGRDLTHYLARLLQEKGHSFSTAAELEIVQHMKKELCYVAENYDRELDNSARSPVTYELPDGSRISLNEERFKCAEALIRPSVMGQDMRGLHEVMRDCLLGCEVDCRADMYCNLIISGGNTMFPGVAERLKNEFVSIFPGTAKIRVIAAPERLNSVWIGGSVLGSLTAFRDMLISKAEYEEQGPDIAHIKCP